MCIFSSIYCPSTAIYQKVFNILKKWHLWHLFLNLILNAFLLWADRWIEVRGILALTVYLAFLFSLFSRRACIFDLTFFAPIILDKVSPSKKKMSLAKWINSFIFRQEKLILIRTFFFRINFWFSWDFMFYTGVFLCSLCCYVRLNPFILEVWVCSHNEF